MKKQLAGGVCKRKKAYQFFILLSSGSFSIHVIKKKFLAVFFSSIINTDNKWQQMKVAKMDLPFVPLPCFRTNGNIYKGMPCVLGLIPQMNTHTKLFILGPNVGPRVTSSTATGPSPTYSSPGQCE